MISLSDDHVRLLRLCAQRLTPHSSQTVTSVLQVVQDVCGIQAQDTAAATLAVRARSSGLLAADVEHARVQERIITRTWGPRGTLHLVATTDLNWLLPLLGPIFIAADQRRRTQLGLDEDTCVRGIRIIRDVLAIHSPLTRAELIEHVATQGLPLEGQARPHLLYRAALEGIICLGPDRGSEATYVLLSDWVERQPRDHPLSQEAAHVELTHRYLNAYGPATPRDQAAWSGLSMNQTRAAWQHIADQLMEVEVAGSSAWMLKTCAARLDELSASTPIVRLLPRFDTYLLGYQHRNLSVPPQHAKRINAGGGMIHPTVLVDGYVVGTWKSKRQKNHVNILVEPFDSLLPEVYPGLDAEVTDLARFLGVTTRYTCNAPRT